jgi:GNAT superfamily N-acetyltransferase
VFVYAAYTKLRESFLLFAMAIDAYKLLPEAGAVAVARVLPWAELALGVALIVGLWPRLVTSATTGLLAVFFAVMVRAFRQGQQISCGCFGLGEPISARTLMRDGVLLALSGALMVAAFYAARRARAGEAPPAAAAHAAPAEKS